MYVSSGDQTQDIRIDDKHLFLVTHLTGPEDFLVWVKVNRKAGTVQHWQQTCPVWKLNASTVPVCCWIHGISLALSSHWRKNELGWCPWRIATTMGKFLKEGACTPMSSSSPNFLSSLPAQWMVPLTIRVCRFQLLYHMPTLWKFPYKGTSVCYPS